ncbi:DNRLRE domain-containing protein [Sphaerisporangium dianthi]|uniref:DNRLRE domain-containing protein n=1 Tax=Sphaerisporangium dianthi TaxID=1436120 RepID=A0ABV9CGF3_9ACTN
MATSLLVGAVSSPASATPSSSPNSPITAEATNPVELAKQEAKKQSKRVEITSYRSEFSTMFANPDGKTLRMEMSTSPVRVKRDDAWEPIDTTLVVQNDVVKPRVAKSDLVLSHGGKPDVLTASAGPADPAAKDDKVQVFAPRNLPTPRLSGNRAEFASVYGNGLDLVITATPTGFRQQIVIRQRPTKPLRLRVPVDLPEGFAFENASDRTVLVKDIGKGKREQILDLSTTMMLDAVAADGSGGPDEGKVGRATTSLERTADGSTLVLSPNAVFLADPTVTYPVTVAAAASDWWEPSPNNTIDTFVNNDAYPDSRDNQLLDRILVGKSNDGAVRWRSYIKFQDIPADSLLRGGRVQNADLVLWNHLSNACGTSVGSGITARQITSSWTPGSLTWTNQPSVTSTGANTEYGAYTPTTACTSEWAKKEWDLVHSVNTIVQAWANGQSNYGFQLAAGNESDLTNWRRYRTTEYTICNNGTACEGHVHQPLLFVDFEPAAEPIQALYVRPRSSSAPTSDEVLAHLDDSVDFEPADPVAVTPAQLEVDAAASTDVVGSLLKDAALPDGMTPEEVGRWSNPNIGEDPMQPPTPKSAVAHWLFDEASGATAADSRVSDNQVALKTGTRWVPGRTGTALSNTPATSQSPSSGAAEARRAAALKAVKHGKRVEVPGETSPTSITFAMPDGRTFTTEVTAGLVRTRRGSSWVPIDTSLVEQGGAIKPKAIDSEVDVEFSTGGTDAFARMTADGRRYALRWPTALARPTVKGSVATYTNAAGAGADLVVTALPSGFRHDVVLRERPAKPLEIHIGVEEGDLTLSKGKGGRLLLRGKDKKLLASVPQPMMWDAAAKGRPLPAAKHAKISTEVVTKDGHTELVLKPDHDFLSDPATKYPVRVDPTITLPTNGDVDVYSDNDASWPADPTGEYLMAGRMVDAVYRTHLRFDTAGLSGQTVTDAKLSLLNFDAPVCGSLVGAGIQVRRLTGAWDVNNLHWGNKPASTTEDAQINRAAINPDCANWPGPMLWNVTGIAQDWAAGAVNHGLVLMHPNESNTADNWRMFTSAETLEFNTPPTLTVTTTGPSSVPAVADLSITPAQDVNGTITATSLTPQLAATVSDTAGGSLTGQFEVEHDPTATGQGTGQIWAGASAAVPSGGQSVVTVPVGKLTDGWKVRWRVRAANAAAATTSNWSGWQLATLDVPNSPSGPSVSGLQVIPSTLVDDKTTTFSVTPELQAQVHDPTGGMLRADFEIEHEPAAPEGQGSGQIWIGSAENVMAGARATVTVPAGKLADGWLVRWRARATSATATSPWSDWQLLMVDSANAGYEPLATAATPIIRTDESFAIAGWVRLDDRTGPYAVADQKGTNAAPFHLGVDPVHGLVFTMKESDSATSSEEGVVSETTPPVGEWFHLAGSYDEPSRSLSLYLNGNLVKTQAISFHPWHADGPFTIGTAIKGGIDDLWVYPRTLSAAEVGELNAHPGQTESPIAALSNSRSPLTSRDSREAKGATPLATDPLPWPTGKAQPVRYTTWQDCDADVARAGSVKFTSFRSRFSGCYSGQLVAVNAEKVNNVLTVKGTVTGDITLLIDVDQSKRAVVIQAKLDNVKGGGTLTTTSVGLKLKTKGYPDSTHCQPKQTSPFGPNLREKSQASWNSSPVENWGMSSSAVGAEGKDLKSTCRFSLLVKVTPIGSKTKYVNLWTKAGVSDKEFQVRCDSAAYVYTAAGGCVFTYRKPYMEMKRNDVNDKGETWEEQYDHIKKALTDPNTPPTYPALGGPSYPDSAGRKKDMPGGSPQRPIHRVVSSPVYDFNAAQREKSEAVCRKEIKKTWISNVLLYPQLAENCDEYPFASTEEGSLGANPDFNFSVLLIKATHNQAHGHVLGAWYGNNRILKGDAFWIKLS